MHEAINDIGTAILRLNDALLKHNFRGLAAVDLMSPEDGQRLKLLASPENGFHIEYGKMDPETGSPVNQAEIAGVLVRWPATKRARHGGGFDWV